MKMSRVVVSSAEIRIRASGAYRNQTVVEAQGLAEIDGRQDVEQFSDINYGIWRDIEYNGDVNFGTQTAASIVADAVAK